MNTELFTAFFLNLRASKLEEMKNEILVRTHKIERIERMKKNVSKHTKK